MMLDDEGKDGWARAEEVEDEVAPRWTACAP